MFSKIKYFIVLFFFVGYSASSAQNTEHSLFEKLDLKLVEKYYEKDKRDQALKELLKLYRNKENLYLQVTGNDVDYIKEKYPEDVLKTIETANQVLNKYFLFRYDWDMEKTTIPYQFEGEIDWTTIPNGDEEWCYMLNRHRFWIDLGKAYLLTDDEKYAIGFVDQVTHWIDNNPLKDELKQLDWRRIEAGIRCENWIKAFEYVKGSKYVTPEFLAKFLNALFQHGEYLNSSFSNFSQTSNWGALEFQGLFNLSQFLTEFKIAKQWQVDTLEKLETCINLQILPDGSQWEQSPMYHNVVFHCFMNVNLIAQQKNIKLPEDIVDKTKAMAYNLKKYLKFITKKVKSDVKAKAHFLADLKSFFNLHIKVFVID